MPAAERRGTVPDHPEEVGERDVTGYVCRVSPAITGVPGGGLSATSAVTDWLSSWPRGATPVSSDRHWRAVPHCHMANTEWRLTKLASTRRRIRSRLPVGNSTRSRRLSLQLACRRSGRARRAGSERGMPLPARALRARRPSCATACASAVRARSALGPEVLSAPTRSMPNRPGPMAEPRGCGRQSVNSNVPAEGRVQFWQTRSGTPDAVPSRCRRPELPRLAGGRIGPGRSLHWR